MREIRENFDKRITQLTEWKKMPVKQYLAEGRELTEEENEKMHHFFSDYSWSMRVVDGNKITFGALDEDMDDSDFSYWGYITVEELVKLKLPKKEAPKVESNTKKILNKDKWYTNLMKKIK